MFSALDTGLAADKLKEMAATSSERVYDTEDLGPVATIKASLTVIQQLAANLAQKMVECENELAISGQTQGQPQSMENESITPISVRANAARKELDETKILGRCVNFNRSITFFIQLKGEREREIKLYILIRLLYLYVRKLEARDSDIRDARLALREKQEELSEMTLRKELAEKRFVTQQHEHETNVEQLKRKLEEAQNQLKRKVSRFLPSSSHLHLL